jgi:hypothetical protein
MSRLHAALVEWQHARNVDVARNIFEFGMKEFAHEPRFVAHYVDLLVKYVCARACVCGVACDLYVRSAGQAQNARALLERVLASGVRDDGGCAQRVRDASRQVLCATVALRYWNMLIDVERAHGDIEAIRSAEKCVACVRTRVVTSHSCLSAVVVPSCIPSTTCCHCASRWRGSRRSISRPARAVSWWWQQQPVRCARTHDTAHVCSRSAAAHARYVAHAEADRRRVWRDRDIEHGVERDIAHDERVEQIDSDSVDVEQARDAAARRVAADRVRGGR